MQIHELPTGNIEDDNKLPFDTGANTYSVSFANLVTYIRDKLTSLTFSALNTSNKTLTGAINELNNNLSISSSNLSLSSGWTSSSNWIKRTKYTYEFYLELSGGTLSVGWNTVATFPSGYRPTATFDMLGLDNRSGDALQVKINSTSNIVQVYGMSAQTSAQVRIHGMFAA